MAGSFPTLKSGNTVFYPLLENHSFGTGMCRFLDDSEQRWRARNMLRRFKLTFNDVNAYDSSLILTFWRSQFGKFDSSWDLTINGSTYPNLAFDSDTFEFTENKRNRHTLTFSVIQVKSEKPTIIPGASTYFPQITSGVMTGLPYSAAYDYHTTSIDLPIGKRYSWKWRISPLGKFAINLPALSDAELVTIKNFFYSMEGRKGEFSFLDPGGNLVPFSDIFSDVSWTRSGITVGSAQTDPKGGNLALRLTGSLSNSLLYCTVLPAGNASGFVLCSSVWARAVGANQQLAIGFLDNGLVNQGFIIHSLPQGVWKRISCPLTLATNNPIIMVIGGSNTWSAGQVIDLFSAQASPMPAPGPRLITPGFDSLRAKCRFDVDDFSFERKQLNENSVTLPIQEYK